MAKANFRPVISSKPLFTVEVAMDASRRPEWIDLIFSVVGRENVYTRRWKLVEGCIDAKTLKDLVSSACGSLEDCILMMVGAQEVLPLST